MGKKHIRNKDINMNKPLTSYGFKEEMDKAFQNVTDKILRVDAVVIDYDGDTGKGRLRTSAGDVYNFTAKRKYMKVGVGISCITGNTRAYDVRRENLVLLSKAS